MLARNEVIFKWSLYAAAAALCILFQGAVCERVVVWGVIPFLYPLAAVIPATYEAPVPATVFALCVGVFCDLLLPEAFPCFYTLSLTGAALCASLLSQSLLPAGFLCSLAAAAVAFLLTGALHCLLFWLSGRPAWGAGAYLMVREFTVTAPFCFPVTLLFRAVSRKVHMYD